MTIILVVAMFAWMTLALVRARKIEKLETRLAIADTTIDQLHAACLDRSKQQEQDAEEVDDHLTIKLAECADELIAVIDSLHGGKRIAKKLRQKYETRIVLKVKDQNPDEPLKQDEMELDEWGGM